MNRQAAGPQDALDFRLIDFDMRDMFQHIGAEYHIDAMIRQRNMSAVVGDHRPFADSFISAAFDIYGDDIELFFGQ